MENKNEGRTAIVTGGGKGVGAGIAKAFAASGMRVCVGWNSNRELAESTLAEIESGGGKAFLCQADVSRDEGVKKLVGETVERWGRLDVLVNNAALQPNLSIAEYTPEIFRRVWDINIGGYVKMTREAIPYLKNSPNPRIINVSSVHGRRPSVFDPAYSMTKAAIVMFSREAALELAKYGVTVNTIDLGACKIEFKTGHYPFNMRGVPGTHENPSQLSKRPTEPKDVGALALYIASEEACNLTGAGIRLDAGLILP